MSDPMQTAINNVISRNGTITFSCHNATPCVTIRIDDVEAQGCDPSLVEGALRAACASLVGKFEAKTEAAQNAEKKIRAVVHGILRGSE